MPVDGYQKKDCRTWHRRRFLWATVFCRFFSGQARQVPGVCFPLPDGNRETGHLLKSRDRRLLFFCRSGGRVSDHPLFDRSGKYRPLHQNWYQHTLHIDCLVKSPEMILQTRLCLISRAVK